MKKFFVTIVNTSSIEVEAENEEQARALANERLDELTMDQMQQIYDASTGWEISDLEPA